MAAHRASSLQVQTVNFGELWGYLKADVIEILSSPLTAKPKHSYERLYNMVYRICTSFCDNVPASAGLIPISAGPSDKNLRPQPRALYVLFRQLLQDYLQTQIVPSLSSCDNALFLSKYALLWRNFSLGIEVIHRIFYFLNKDYVAKEVAAMKSSSGDSDFIHDVKTLGFMLWRRIVYTTSLQTRTLDGILSTISQDRNGQHVSRSDIKSAVSSIVSMGQVDTSARLDFYQRTFEATFLDQSRSFYRAESDRVFYSLSDELAASSPSPSSSVIVSEYCRRMEKRVEEEQRRVVEFLHPSTGTLLVHAVVDVTIISKLDRILPECGTWFDNDQVDDIRRLYRMLVLIPGGGGLEPLRTFLEERTNAVGCHAISAVAKEAMKEPKVFVDAILSVFCKYDALIRTHLGCDKSLLAALDRGCKRFLHKNDVCNSTTSPSRTAELLAKYCHLLLRPSSTSAASIARHVSPSSALYVEEGVDAHLTIVLSLLRLLNDKDVFQKFYTQFLARRLVQNNYSHDQETLMITKLKELCGYDFTYKNVRMMTDMELSNDLTREFLQQHQPSSDSAVDFSVLVLTTGSWPLTASVSSPALPKELEECQASFASFYHARHSGRKLLWLYQHSNAVLRATFGSAAAKYDFQVTTSQMLILLCFSSSSVSSLTVGEIIEQTNLPRRDTIPALQVLFKSMLLSCNKQVGGSAAPAAAAGSSSPYAPSSDLDNRAVITFNTSFKSNHRKIPLYTMTAVSGGAKSGGDDFAAAAMQSVAVDRSAMLQACIVRIMKSRKKLALQLLISEVMRMLSDRFDVRNTDVKRNLETLLEKEYLARSEDDPNVFVYLA